MFRKHNLLEVSHDEGGDLVGAGGTAIMCRRERSCIGCRASPHGIAMQKGMHPIILFDRIRRRCYFLGDRDVHSRCLIITDCDQQNLLHMLYDGLKIKMLL